jgi:O-antigen/teichoic acid export membrane protein
MQISQLFKYFRVIPFATSSEQGRADERRRLATLTIVANLLSRGLAIFTMILTVKYTVPYLGVERFGVWMTIASFAGMLSFMDLGVGNALTNKVAQSSVVANSKELCRVISGGLGILVVLGFGVGIVLMGLAFILPWDILIKVSDINLYKEIKDSAIIFSGLFGLTIFTNGLQRVFAGLQRSFESHIISAAGTILALFSLWIAARMEASIPILLLATLGIQSISNFSLFYILTRRGQFSLSEIQMGFIKEFKSLIKIGGAFFLLQIGAMVALGSDNLIISSQIGASEVAMYAVLVRLFQIASQPISIMNSSLWGAYTDAYSRNEKKFIRNTLKISLITTSIFMALMTAFLIIFGEKLVGLWTERVIQIPLGLIIVYGVWVTLDAISNSFGIFLNGCGILRPQIFTALFFITVGVWAKFSFINLFGIEGMVCGAILTFILIQPVVYGWLFRSTVMEALGMKSLGLNK